MATASEITIVVPVYRDWAAFHRLTLDLDMVGKVHGYRWDVLAVNDGSNPPPTHDFRLTGGDYGVRSIEVLDLACNLGHQRAIAIGLVAAAPRDYADCVVVMDADGEDRPHDLPRLLQLYEQAPSPLVAVRQERSESFGFRVFYFCYRILFRLLTGRTMRFGNFCVLPMQCARHLIYRSELWNNLPATLLRTATSIAGMPISRGHRYDGRSNMNFESLVVHGLGAVAVFSDIVFLRILVVALALGGATAAAIAVVILIRLFTELAIPGWASYMVGALLVMLFQAVIMALAAMFLLLANRSASSFVPALDAMRYVVGRRSLFST